jgi:hypothetical protein
MFATHNSVVFGRRISRRFSGLTLAAAIGFSAVEVGIAADENSDKAKWSAHAQEVFSAAQKRLQSEPTNNAAAVQFARAGFDRAEFATNDTERAAIAVHCIDACRKLIARDSNSAPAHLYLGMNLGQLAKTKLLGALKIVNEMEREFKTARALDEQFNRGGADRALGRLYFEAPTTLSIGNKTKARHHLQRAAILFPEYPENRLNLAEAYVAWQDKKGLQQELQAIEKIWPAARTNFTGIEWESSWHEWKLRKERLERKAKELMGR